MATRPVAPRPEHLGELLVWDVWMYHATEGAKIFKNYDLPKLGADWFDDPAKAAADLEKKTAPKAK